MKTSGQSDYTNGFVFKYILSCCAATVAESVTYPLDLTKTRLQIQGEGSCRQNTVYRGMIGTAYGIAKEEGVHKLWQGVTPAIYRHIVYTGCRMGFYEWIRDNLLGKNVDGTYSLWKSSLSGLSAGAMAQFIASPTDLIKVQMQMEGRRRLDGKPTRYKNTWHAFSVVRRENGFRGLWKGWVPNVQRAALVNLGDLTTYDTAKHLILTRTRLKDNYVTHSLASACAGLVSAILGTPADVVKTRIMNQQYVNGRGVLYSSSIDCLVKTVRVEGFWAMYKGFLPIWARMRSFIFIVNRLPRENCKSRRVLGDVQRVSSDLGSHGAVVVGVLVVLRTNQKIRRCEFVLNVVPTSCCHTCSSSVVRSPIR